MWNSYKKALDDILNKKFSKNFEIGYDTLEVDMFFDKTRNFIGKQHQVLLELRKIIDEKTNEIDKLKKEVESKDSTITILNSEIETYKNDGYQSQRITKAVSSVIRDIDELKKRDKR